jgi:putative hemolysin
MNLYVLSLPIIAIMCLSACAPQSGLTQEPVYTEEPEGSLANPASVHCEEQGGKIELRTEADGGQYGVCIFPDGGEGKEWAYFKASAIPVLAGHSQLQLRPQKLVRFGFPLAIALITFPVYLYPYDSTNF